LRLVPELRFFPEKRREEKKEKKEQTQIQRLLLLKFLIQGLPRQTQRL